MVAAKQTNEPELNFVPTLALKIGRIMAAVGNIAKSGRNKFQNYDFIQSDDVVDAIRNQMINNNVIIIPRMLGYEMSAETKGFHAVVQFEFTLIDADSGESMSATWYGEASDSSDKSFSKAGTSALKYWLLKTFMISAGEPDADKEGIEHDHQERQQRTPRQALNGNGQQERRIPPKSNQDAPNLSAASKTPPNTNDGVMTAAEIADAWEEPFVKQFIKHYEGRADVNELLAMLKVKRFGEWKHGGIAAYKVVDGALSIKNMEF